MLSNGTINSILYFPDMRLIACRWVTYLDRRVVRSEYFYYSQAAVLFFLDLQKNKGYTVHDMSSYINEKWLSVDYLYICLICHR